MWFYRLELIKVSHYPAKFGGQRHCGSGNVFDLSRDLARPRDQRVIYFMSRSQSRQIEILPSFVVISTLEDKVVKASYDFMGGYPSR